MGTAVNIGTVEATHVGGVTEVLRENPDAHHAHAPVVSYATQFAGNVEYLPEIAGSA